MLRNAYNSAPPTEASALVWQVHLRKRQPSRLPVLLLGIGFGALCAWGVFHQPLPVVAAIVLLLGSVSEYLLPITHRLDDTGAQTSYGLHRFQLRWSEARRVIPVSGGVILSPLPAPSRLDSFRGVYLRFAKRDETGNRDEVMAWIESRLPEGVSQCP